MNAIKTITAVVLLTAACSSQAVTLNEPANATGGSRFEDTRGVSLLPSCTRTPALFSILPTGVIELNADLLQVREGVGKDWSVRRSAVELPETDTNRWISVQRWIEAEHGGQWIAISQQIGTLDVGRCPQLRLRFKRR